MFIHLSDCSYAQKYTAKQTFINKGLIFWAVMMDKTDHVSVSKTVLNCAQFLTYHYPMAGCSVQRNL